MKELRNKNVKSVFGGIGIASLLCLLMVLMSWSAMVTNSDINSESAVVTDSQDTKTDSTETFGAEVEKTSFDAESFGFDEDYEMLGMRTEDSKTFINEEGNLVSVHSINPLHYENSMGQLVDIDTSILVNEQGYYVEDIFTPVQFGQEAIDGLTMMVGDEVIVAGMNPYPVVVYEGLMVDPQLDGIYTPYTNIEELDHQVFNAPTTFVEVGGNSINYPLSKTMDLRYHVSANEVKQEFIIDSLSEELNVVLDGQLEAIRTMDARADAFFGLQETVGLPDDVQLFSNGEQILDNGEIFSTDSMIEMRKIETGQVIGYIAAPYAYDNSLESAGLVNAEKVVTNGEKVEVQEELEPSTTYFLTLDGTRLTITTAVNMDWFLDDYTTFPVVIDPTVGSNVHSTDSTAGSYLVCDVDQVDCGGYATTRDFIYDWPSYGGYHQSSPRFDFTFTHGATALTVASVSATYEINSKLYAGSNDYGGLLIMEDCGGDEPASGLTNLNSRYSPSDCTGVPLPPYTAPTTSTGYTTYTFDGFSDYSDCEADNDIYGTSGYQYSITSDMTVCDGSSVDFIIGTGSDENGGIFSAGTWEFTAFDSYGDGFNGGSGIYFQERAVGGTTWTTTQTNVIANGVSDTMTIASGNEFRLAYDCPGSYCYPGENEMELVQVAPTPILSPAAPGGAGGSPTGAEAATVTFTVASGEEAYFEFTSGNLVGDADETEIYYRQSGTSGWSTYWDICSNNPVSNPPCQAATTYTSENSVLIQTPGTYEALVWDTLGDGSGNGATGIVIIGTAGGATGVIQTSPSGLRLNSLISSEQIVPLSIGIPTNTPTTVTVCGSVVSCGTGSMAMFKDVYQNGSNGGYIEFGLGWAPALNSYNGWTSGQMDGHASFSNFYLTVELEDNTPDATPPTVEFDHHYTGVTSYVDGQRTLYMALMDTGNPIDSTSANGPKVHYSTDGGQSYSVSDAASTNACTSKNQVCGFAANIDTTAGDTVQYYWTYSDAAAIDNTKIPPQSPNAGRFPAAGAADLTFTIADIYSAPTDGTDMKVVTYMDHIRQAEPHTYPSTNSYASDVDRQMTYYTSTGEFHFEFGLDRCGSNFPSSIASRVPGTDGQGNCFFDIDSYPQFGEEAGHWDINWEGVATDCTPGISTCTGAPTNNLELDAYFGGPLGINGLIGAGNLVFVFDSANNEWMISGAGTGLNAIDPNAPDVNTISTYTSNIHTPAGAQPVTTQVSNGFSGWGNYGGFESTFTVAAGDVGRLVYICGSYCTEGGVSIQDTATGTVYDMGRNNKRSGGGYQSPIGQTCTSSSGFSGTFYSDSYNGPCNTIGTIAPGTYDLYHWDYYGDGSNGGTINLQTITGSFSATAAPPFQTNSYDGGKTTVSSRCGASLCESQSFVIDLADAATPNMGTNSGFGGVPFGTAAGQFNYICVTTAGHYMFMENTEPRCNPDADSTSAGGQWQGFALGAGNVNFQTIDGNGMLWQIRDVAPDPDNNAPVITGGEIGDSHAEDRTVSFSIGDSGPFDSGLDTSPVPGTGPTIVYTITDENGVSTTTSAALTPSGDRNTCSSTDCDWSHDFSLTRGDSVSYYVTAKDLWPAGSNTVTSSTYSFDVGNPTNTLVIEWHEYQAQSYYVDSNACSMQVIMYDVTNEFEFHYDENCYNYYKSGLVGIREDNTNTLQLGNYYGYIASNPHSNNLRFTMTDSGDYVVETFDLGMTNLPLASSTQIVPVTSYSFSNDDRCDSNTDWINYGQYCAGNFDIPDDFNFEFYGQSFDGSDSMNRIQATGSGVLHFVDDGSTNAVRVEGNGGTCWPSSGRMCDLTTTSSLFPDMMMAPYWSRENMDFCGISGGTTCQGMWYRTMPFDGQGKTVFSDITDDTTWYLIDSPIKVQPTDASGYLSIDADLTIEPGVEVIIGENKGISFDGGVKADGTCTKFTALGTETDPITFNADTSVNPNALWHGLAFTSDCAGATVEDRHVMQHVSISNTNHAAITAGSRPADSSYQGCGTATQDCDVGEFTLSDVSYSNVESAFAHGSGQGTVVTMSNFAITDSRSSCFNFAQNTVATLTGTAANPSTMTRCNTNNYDWAGAIASDVSGSTAGSLTMEYVNIVDSKVTLIRTDLQTVTISDVTATTPNVGDQWRWTGQSQWTYDNTGVNLGLSHGANAEVTVTNFNAPNYAQGWICAASKVSLTNVDLGTGFMPSNHRFDIDPYCGATTNVPGSMGADSVFDGVTAPEMTMYRTFPGTADQITVSNDFKIAELGVTGGSTDAVAFSNLDVTGVFVSDGCGANLELVDSNVGQMSSFCSTPNDASSIRMETSTMTHGSFDSAIYLEQSQGILVDVDVTSTTASGNGPYLLYGGFGSSAFLIDVTLNGNDCADNSGKTSDCFTAVDTSFVNDPEIYYGGFANALTYRLGVDSNTGLPDQIPEQGVTVTSSVLDSTGAELFPSKVIYQSVTDSNGETDRVPVITGDHTGTTYDSHIVRASGAAGAGQANPLLFDGTPATEVQFENGVLQTGVPLADFGTYNLGSYADIRLVSPPVTLNDAVMDCAWMATNDTFSNVFINGVYEFKGATMVLHGDLYVDSCTVVLEGSSITFREDSVVSPSLTIGNGGTVIMKTDTATGDRAKMSGESNLDAVDIILESGSTLDVQAGSISNFVTTKTGQMVVPSGAELKLGGGSGGAFITSSDISTMSSTSYPLIDVDGGLVTVTSDATLSGSGNIGVGLDLTNGGEVNGDGLTISNMLTGINSNGGSLNIDGYTSDSNTNGVVAQDGPKLPTMFTSATLQGITQNYPLVNFGSFYGQMPGLDNCWYYHMYACWEWYEYTVDLTGWVGQEDYLQPSMMLNYGGTWNYYYSSVGGAAMSLWQTPYITLDNLLIEVTDNSGNTHVIEDSSDVGYYPYGNTDPAVVNDGATYLGGTGGAPFWDCNYRARSYNPWRFGTNLYDTYPTYTSSPSIGNLYGVNDVYPDELGFRLSRGDTAEPIGVSFYPYFSWGFDDPIMGRYGPGPAGVTNDATWHQTSVGETRSSLVGTYGSPNYEACNARSPVSYTSAGSNMMLEWPTVDLTDASIEKVELKFDMMHRYFGSFTGWHANNNQDSVDILARAGSNPASFGDYSEAVPGKGVILSNSEISGATVGIDLLGGTLANIDGLDINDPGAFAIRTQGSNDVYLNGLDVDDSGLGANQNYGFYTTSTSSGTQEISNSDFNGLGTAVYLTNDVSTTISDTVISNGDVGFRVGSQSSANHIVDTMTLNNNNIGVQADGTGELNMNDVDITSTSNDVEISDSSVVYFLDGTVDQAKVTVASTATGSFDRDRSFVATLDADGTPLENANVIMSSRDAATSTTGVTDANGVTSGLSFSVYDLGAGNAVTDYSAYFNTYTLSSVAKVSYSWTDSTTNSGDFRYVQASPTLTDAPLDVVNSVNAEIFSLVDTIDVRVCGTDSNFVMIESCAGTLGASSSRTYNNGMIEYGDDEGLYDGSSTMDLTGKAIMIDTGVLELRNGVNYILDNAIVFDTGYTTQYGDGFAQWITDVPYGTTLTMNGGEVNGLYPLTATGDVVGLIIGGLAGSFENALNIDVDGVTFNNIVGLATGAGDRTFSSTSGSYNTYIPSTVEIENSFIYYYRDLDVRPSLYSDADYCVRLTGMDGATISGNTFADCVMGVTFTDSDWATSGSTSVTHAQIGSDNVVIDGNTFVGTVGYNIMAWPDADADNIEITNNVMTCTTCYHVRFMDDTSVNPMVSGNTFNGGDWGVYTDETEYVNVNGNTFNNIANIAIRGADGDVSAVGNVINDPGEYAIYLESLEKPTETVSQVVAGVNSPQPDDGIHFVSWNGDTCFYPTWWTPCVSSDVIANNAAGQEMVLRFGPLGSYPGELTINVKDPDGIVTSWNPPSILGAESHNAGSPSPLILDKVGTYTFSLEDSYGDGANGGGFEVVQAAAGAWSAGSGTNTNPKQFWDPGIAGLLSVEPGYRGPYVGYAYSPSFGLPVGYSNTMDGILIQNNGADPIGYEMTGIDQWGDGWNGNYMRFQVAPIGSWTTSTTGYPPVAGNTGGPVGTIIGGIGGSSTTAYPWVGFTSGTYSAPIEITLDPGYELRFAMHRGGSYAGEVALQLQEITPPDNSWVGPVIANNDINFDSVNNNPNAVGIYLSNCDIQDYTILTQSNTIDIGQNAIWNDGCAWNDQGSVLTGSDIAGSYGYNDDNTFSVDLGLDGTTISGFETGVFKTGGGTLSISNGATITAGAGGIGVHTDGIDVSVIDATFDGGATGTGMMVENSNYAWLYPMDVTGNVGLHAKNSEILWDAGEVDADTILIAETVTGTVQSLTDPAAGGGAGVASASSTTMIDARSDTRLTVVDWPLVDTKIITDSSSIVDEANWLDIDANHLGGEPLSQVGVTITSDQGFSAYSSPIFTTTMIVDGNSDDWVGGNALNPSGYAMPGSVGGPMHVTTDSGSLVLGFDSVDTTASDVYVYVDSNDMAGSSLGYNGAHSLPYDADYAIVATSTGVDVYYYNDPAWVLNPTSNAVSAQGTYLEIGIPISALGGSSVNTMNIVATVQNVGTNDVTAASPSQTTIVGTGAESLDSAYELTLNKLDLADGTIDNEVLLHRSFEFGNPPTTPHNYQVMVKTPAETRHTCDFDWATETNVAMDTSKSLTFEILRACPEITAALDDITVNEDSGSVDLDLSTYVDDEQDVEDDMEWEVVGSNMDAFANILSDFSDLSAATGTYSITPINDQFGSFDMTFEVVDSHGQTASKTITYTVKNVNDAPVICDARTDVDPDCDNGDIHLYADAAGDRYNSRDEGFTSYSKPLGKTANDTLNSFIRDMANEQDPVNQVYTWGASATCDQISVALQTNVNGVDEIVVTENTNWEYGGVCDITLTLSDDGAENTDATPVVVQFAVAPVNDVPVIASEGVVDSADGSNSFQGVPDGSYRLDLVEDTVDQNALTFDLSAIKSDIDHLDADLSWELTDTNTCDSSNYYTHTINGDTLEFTLIKDATTNAEPWEVDMLNNDGKHQTRTANGRCEMTLTLSDTANPPSYMPNYELLEQQGYAPNNYQQESVSVTLSVEVDNVVENVPDYYLDETEGFSFNGVSNVMPGTYVPVDFSIHAGGDDGDYTYDHLLVVSLHSDGHTEVELPQYFTPPAFGESLDIEDWEVYITDLTTEVWVEVDVVTCTPNPAGTCTVNEVQTDNPESHNAISSSQVFGKWSEPGRIGEDANGQQSNRRPAFEDKNWCNNMMSTNGGNEVAWSESSSCQHTEQGYNGAFGQDWQTADVALPVTVTTIGALSVASFAPSIIAVALTGLFVSALVLAGRRDDDEEEFVEEQISDDDAAVSPVIATILMVAITVVLSGVVYVWAAQLADTDTKGVPRVTFTAENVDTGSVETDHWKITVGQAQTVLATQAVEVTVIYLDANGVIVSETTNLASTDHVYGFSPFNSDSLVTFGDVVTIDEDETISSFSTGDDIYVKTQTADGHKLVDATVRIVYSPGGDNQGAVLKTYSGLTWNQPV